MDNYKPYYEAFDLSALIVKYIKQELSDEEKLSLEKWLQSSEKNVVLFEQIVQEAQMQAAETTDKAAAWKAIQDKRSMQVYPRVGRRLRSYAALVACLFLFSGLLISYFYSSTQPAPLLISSKQTVDSVQQTQKNLLSSNKVILTLADGTQIDLNQADSGTLAHQSGTSVRKTADGMLDYQGTTASATSQQLTYNQIQTGHGGIYQLDLPDGTKVWLNAGSSLKYPIAFHGKQRKVELVGEAYFEVAKNKDKPFYVQTKGMEIKVLGTHFNVEAYADEKQVKTSLLEGSIRVKKGLKEMLLIPGQQVIAREEHRDFILQHADVEQVMAWKNGYFLFRDEPLVELMQGISKWYDVDVSYASENLKTQTFGGKFSKNNALSELLNSLTLTGTVKFKVEGRRVIVMP